MNSGLQDRMLYSSPNISFFCVGNRKRHENFSEGNNKFRCNYCDFVRKNMYTCSKCRLVKNKKFR
jgi:hypothetical protein